MFFSTGFRPAASVVYQRIADIARRADADGMTRVWLPERHFVEFGAVHPAPAVLAAALAGATRSIRLAAGSVVAPLHEPIRITEAWSVVDNLSGGRVDLALAPGWRAEDFALAPDCYANRHQTLEDNARLVQRLWRGDSVERLAGDGRQIAVHTLPRPVQPELPLWITAARNPQTFKLAGSLGANLLTYLVDLGLEGLGARIADYRAARMSAGHDPSAGIVTVMLHTHLAETSVEARDRARQPYIDSFVRNRQLVDSHTGAALSEAQATEIATAQFDRLFERLSFVGSIDAAVALVDRLTTIGVDETACLIDFIDNFDIVERGLPALSRFVGRARNRETVRAASPDDDGSRYHGEEFYAYIESIGGHYGPSFRGIESIELVGGRAEVKLALPGGTSAPDPILLDAIVSTAHAFALRPALRGSMRPLALPVGVRQLRLEPARSAGYRVLARERSRDGETATFEMDVETNEGVPVATLEGVAFKRLPLSPHDPRANDARATFHHLSWAELETSLPIGPASWVVCCAEQSEAALYADLLSTFSTGTKSVGLVIPQRGLWIFGDRQGPREASLYTLASIERLRAERQVETIVVLVRGAHSLPNDDCLPDPAAAAAWAAAGAVRAESGRAVVRVLDVARDAGLVDVVQSLRLFAGSAGCAMAAARTGKLYSPHLTPTEMVAERCEPCIGERALVTGGHGQLGSILTDWLLEDGAHEVVALSRTGRRYRREAHPTGGHVVDLRGDVTEIGSLSCPELQDPFDVVFHLAGKDPGRAADATAINEAFSSKFDGFLAVAQHAAQKGSRGRLVLLGSIAGLIGAVGQPAYSSANAAASAAALHVCMRTGLRVSALAVDPVGAVGMAGATGVADSFAARSITPLDPATVLRAVALAMTSGIKEVAIVAPGNHGTSYARKPNSHRAVLSELGGLDEQALLHEVRERTRQEVAKILEIPPEQVDFSANLYDMRFDSVMGVELRNTLEQKYNIKVGLAALMEAQCLEDVVRVLLPAATRSRAGQPKAATPAADIVL
nr:MupA/Atu3671 family FMN-dependent luciferase-like monooxygenase [Bradyrhizobium manausense]